MGEYTRTTRECTLHSMRPDLAAAIREHIAIYTPGDLEAALLFSCETHSTKQKKGFFGGPPEVVDVGVLLTAQWLVWAIATKIDYVTALSVPLKGLQIRDYEQTPEYKLIPDTGVVIYGHYTNAAEASSAFLGLGPEFAAIKFRDALQQAYTKANQ